MGMPKILCVNTASTRNVRSCFFPFFSSVTTSQQACSIKLYRISATAASRSVWSACSALFRMRSMRIFSSTLRGTTASPSMQRMAKKRGFIPVFRHFCCTICWISSKLLRQTPLPISGQGKAIFFRVLSIAHSISSSQPCPLAALMATTGKPILFERSGTSILFPCLFTSSIIFSATTVGTPISINCTVRYRLRCKLVASTTSITTSGFSFIRKSRATTSSAEYGESE